MSDTVSTLIAFVGFLIILSMLAQAVQEALKSALKLKSGVWERFFLSLYKHEFQIGRTDKNVEAAKPTSFWRRLWSGEFVGDFETRLKRLKEVVIRADDLLQTTKQTLHDIASMPPGNPYTPNLLIPKSQELMVKLKELTGVRLDALLSIYDRLDANTIANLSNALHDFEKAFPDLGFTVKQLEGEALENLRKECDKLLAAIIAAEKKISDYRQQIEYRFDAWIAQVNEEYRRNMVKWTVVTGALLVLMFNADAFTIYKYLHTNPEAQEKVAKQVETDVAKALTSTAEDLIQIDKLVREGNVEPAIKSITDFSQYLEDDFRMLKDEDNAKKAAAIKSAIEGISTADKDKKLRTLNDLAGEVTRLFAVVHKDAITYQAQGILSLDLPLGWTHDLRIFCSIQDKCSWEFWRKLAGKAGGLLLTAFLITFGAPFWNDVLTAFVGFKNSMKAKS